MSDSEDLQRTAKLKQVLHENPWFRLLEQDVTQADGSHIDYYSVDFRRPVVAIVPRRGDEFLLVRTPRFIIGQYSWEVPAGFVEEGESPEDAVHRELKEETGHAAGSVEHLMTYFPTCGTSNQRFEAYLAGDITQVTGEFDRNEVTEFRWFPEAEIRRMIAENEIVDGLTLPALMRVLL